VWPKAGAPVDRHHRGRRPCGREHALQLEDRRDLARVRVRVRVRVSVRVRVRVRVRVSVSVRVRVKVRLRVSSKIAATSSGHARLPRGKRGRRRAPPAA